MDEKVAAELVLTGTFLGDGTQKWRNRESGDSGENYVLVFEGDSPAYPEKVRVGKNSVTRAKTGAPVAGAIGSVKVFAGKFGELWFKEWAN